MTAVANPPSFANINRPAWGNGGQSLNGSINHDDVRSMFVPRKSMQRTNSSSSISSTSSNSSTSSTLTVLSNGSAASNGGPVGGTGPSSVSSASDASGLPITTLRKQPIRKAQWSVNKQGDGQADYLRAAPGRQPMGAGPNGVSSLHQLPPFVPGQTPSNGTNGIMARPAGGEGAPQQGQPVLYLLSLNGTFDRKTISVPFLPDTLRIGRQTNKSTTPTTINGYFDSKVLSRQHAEIWADRQGKIWIRDIKSSNGTFVNGTRLSAENRESEPHELQTNDHLELGIDIVSEDQKSVVHHKVAAKVEHAGFINTSNSLLDMNFGDLDPANGAMLGPQMNGMAFRGRTGSQASLGPAGRMAPTSNMAAAQNNGMALQRGLWFTGPSTEAIVKKINQEMRIAKQQSQDLQRTQEFIKALLSKDDIRNEPSPNPNPNPNPNAKAEPAEASRAVQMANGVPFRADPKARFSDPPAPPPQQPLPEKPDVPSLKRGTTERPKSGSSTSPIRQDVVGQVLQLTDALNTAKREIDTQRARMNELEDKLHKEEEARKSAEELARRLEEAAAATTTTAAVSAASHMNGSAKGTSDPYSTLEDAFEPPAAETANLPGPSTTDEAKGKKEADKDRSDAIYRARIDSMMTEMEGMKKQLDAFRERAEKAEAERDADRETLAQMVKRIRQRDEEDARLAATKTVAGAGAKGSTALDGSATAAVEPLTRSFSRGRKRNSAGSVAASDADSGIGASLRGSSADGSSFASAQKQSAAQSLAQQARRPDDDLADDGKPGFSRSDTITPASASLTKVAHERALVHGIPYASMVGVVLIGMGLMAYLNGWQPQPPRLDR